MNTLIFILVSSVVLVVVKGRKHHLVLENETRNLIHISQFGYFRGGMLEVSVNSLGLPAGVGDLSNQIGFTVDRTLSDGINPYPHNGGGGTGGYDSGTGYGGSSGCALSTAADDLNAEGVQRVVFAMDFKNSVVRVGCSRTMDSIKLFPNISSIPIQYMDPEFTRRSDRHPVAQSSGGRPAVGSGGTNNMMLQQRKRRKRTPADGSDGTNNKSDTKEKAEPLPTPLPASASSSSEAPIISKDEIPVPEVGDLDSPPPVRKPSSPTQVSSSCQGHTFPIILSGTPGKPNGPTHYSTQFVLYVPTEETEGLYNLYFHHCGPDVLGQPVHLDMNIDEQNREHNYLSAGEIPLPALYTMMSFLFFTLGCFWVFILKKSRKETGVSVFKIHYLMGVLVYLKSLSLLFHAINYHSIERLGTHVEAWAVLYYVTHLLKGALLFITILLIGTGYAFVKHLLSDKDKKIFMIVIPLQVLANVAEIIIEESEEGEIKHTTWKIIFITVDLFCCGAILFPVVWSIRHLQEASGTDGKAATNLRKLKLFRHFYMIVVCYIYFTRIVVNMLLKITVPFQYEWLDAMFLEMTTFLFFVLTGYKFRPARNNPYLELASNSDDEDDELGSGGGYALTESGLTTGVSKRGSSTQGTKKKKTLKEIVIWDANEDDTDDDEEVLLDKQTVPAESSKSASPAKESSHAYD